MSTKKTIKFLLGCALSAFFLYLAFRNVKFHQLADVFRRIQYLWTIPFVIITVYGMYLRAVRWRWILKPRYTFSSRRLFPSLIIGFALNSLLPLRAGEFARPFVLSRREKIPYSTILATVVVERIIDGITLLFCFMIVLLFVQIDPDLEMTFGKYTVTGDMLGQLSRKSSLVLLVLLLGAVSLIVNPVRRIYAAIIDRLPLLGVSMKEKLKGILEGFSHGFHSLRDVRLTAVIFLYSIVIWAMVGFSLQVMAWGFPGLEMNFYHGMAVMIIICIAIMIPAAPGYWGLYECGAIFALMALGLAGMTDEGNAMALGFSLVIHTLQIIPIVIIGIFFILKENISLSQIEKMAKKE